MAHPERFGKYRITGVLGEGAMGVVYRGFDPDIRRVVALKTIRHQTGSGAELVANSAARFRNEAQAAGRLLHPGIVSVYDFGDDGSVAYIAMEFVEGHTLSHYLAQKVRFTPADMASVATQLVDALGHAHEHGVWHRDIKPSNVIMTKHGRVKIADFGIARTDNSGLTQANSVLGTPMYMAPEQFMGLTIDHRIDLYSVGVVLYQLIAGRPPFVGPPESLMYKVVHEVPVPPSQIETGTRTPLLDGVVAKALAKQPAERFAHAIAFRDAVAAAIAQPVPSSVCPETVFALPAPTEYIPTERVQSSPASTSMARAAASADIELQSLFAAAPSTGSGVPTHWNPGVLAKVEAALAQHVGPLAAVLVRRAARDCHDVPALYARLAEQITQASAREAFLGHASRSGLVSSPGTDPRTGGSSGSSGSGTTLRAPTNVGPFTPTAISGSSAQISDALIEQAQKLMAAQVGPIAKVLVKRAAERNRNRDAFFAQLVDAAPPAARAALLAELTRLASGLG